MSYYYNEASEQFDVYLYGVWVAAFGSIEEVREFVKEYKNEL